ncbi:MAG: DUF423 domain-containing protein [Saprospiraceae bacterium]|nr:DUF423 domain-containing protein [Saprospiraceae bacterium]
MQITYRQMLRIAALCGALAVITGAFGAHTLKGIFEARQLDSAHLLAIYEKGVQYQFYHTLALALVAVLMQASPGNRRLPRAGMFFLFGIICFSGSLYLLACRDLIPFSVAWVGPVTPLGGLSFIAGWVFLLLSARD